MALLRRERSSGGPGAGAIRLLLASGARAGTEYLLLGAGPWRLGRDPALPLALHDDAYVSHVHAELTRCDGGVRVDVFPAARNPVRIAGREVAPGDGAVLRAGETLRAGRSILVLCRPVGE